MGDDTVRDLLKVNSPVADSCRYRQNQYNIIK